MWNRAARYTRVKLCLFEHYEAAYEVSRLVGVDALGFHFLQATCADWRTRAEALCRVALAVPAGVSRVLLSDFSPGVLAEVLDTRVFDSVQLYPDWPPDVVAQLRNDYSVKVLKVMSAQSFENCPSDDDEFLSRYGPVVDAVLLDSCREGGSGRLADLEHCVRVVERSPVPVFLAGGLTPANVASRIKSVKPFGVDVESGVSVIAPDGQLLKSVTLCRDFVDAVMRVDRELLTATAQPAPDTS